MEEKILRGKIKTVETLLIEELQKAKPTTQHKAKGVIIKPGQEYVNYQDPDKVCSLVKQIPGFREFMIFHQITHEAVLSASPMFFYRKYKKGETIYNENDKPEFFYGIIKGTVSIRKKEKDKQIKLHKSNMANLVFNESILEAINMTKEQVQEITKDFKMKKIESNLLDKPITKHKERDDSPVSMSKPHKENKESKESVELMELLKEGIANADKNASINNVVKSLNVITAQAAGSSPQRRASESPNAKKREKAKVGTVNTLLHFKPEKYFDVSVSQTNYIEREVKVKTKGECFGYDGLMNKKLRTSTTVALTDCHMFLLTEEDFDRTINKSIKRAEIERKLFLISRIKAFSEYRDKFEKLFKSINTLFKKNRDFIYNQNSPANSIYMIYQGECNLMHNKTFTNKQDVKPSTDLNCDYKYIMTLDRGDVSGLEALQDGAKYDYNLIASKEFTIVLEINLNLMQDLKEPIIRCLKKLRNKKTEIIDEIIQKRSNENKKMRITYKQDVMKEKVHINMLDFQNKLETEISSFRKTQKPVPKPNFTNFVVKLGKEKILPQNTTTIITKKKSGVFKFESADNPFKINYENLFTDDVLNTTTQDNYLSQDNMNLEEIVKETESMTNTFSQSNINSAPVFKYDKRKSQKRDSKFADFSKRPSTINTSLKRKSDPIVSKLGKRRISPENKALNSTIETNKSTMKNSYNTITFDNSLEKEYIPYSLKTANYTDILTNKIKKSKSVQKSMVLQNVNRISFKFRLDKSIENWKTSNKVKGHYFNSGVFNIPMFSKFH